MYTVAVQRELIAQHFMIGGDFGPENHPHSHRYRVEVRLAGRSLDSHGFLVDIDEVAALLAGLLDTYRDRTLNHLPEFQGLNPSLEHLCRILCRRLADGLQRRNLATVTVAIWESDVGLGRLERRDDMTIALVLYGRLDTLTGGFLYDRYLVDALQRRGHRVEVIGLPWRRYGACLLDNFSRELCDRLRRGPWDLILQDELVHPSLFRLNRRIRRRGGTPIVSIVHQVLCRQPRRRWINLAYRQVERGYLQTVDAFIFNSAATRDQVRQLVVKTLPHCVARPAGSRLGTLSSQGLIAEKGRPNGPLELLFVGHLSPVKGLHALLTTWRAFRGTCGALPSWATWTPIGVAGARRARSSPVMVWKNK